MPNPLQKWNPTREELETAMSQADSPLYKFNDTYAPIFGSLFPQGLKGVPRQTKLVPDIELKRDSIWAQPWPKNDDKTEADKTIEEANRVRERIEREFFNNSGYWQIDEYPLPFNPKSYNEIFKNNWRGGPGKNAPGLFHLPPEAIDYIRGRKL